MEGPGAARAAGFGVGAVQSPVTGTLVLEEAPYRLRGLLSGTLQIGYPIGFFIASLVVPTIYEDFGWRYIFLMPLVFMPFAWVVWRYLREPPAFEAARRARAGKPPPSTATLFRPEYRRKTIVLFLGQFLQVVAYGATFLLTAYFREARGWEAREAIEMVGLSYGVGALGYILAAWVGEFVLNRRTTIVAWCWLGSLAFAAMIWWAESWWATAVTFSLMTFFFYGATAVQTPFGNGTHRNKNPADSYTRWSLSMFSRFRSSGMSGTMRLGGTGSKKRLAVSSSRNEPVKGRRLVSTL